VREVGYGLSLAGASAADLVKSMQANSEPDARDGSLLEKREVCSKRVRTLYRSSGLSSPVHRKLLSFSRPGCTDSLRFVF
jgi:hypothetical protein